MTRTGLSLSVLTLVLLTSLARAQPAATQPAGPITSQEAIALLDSLEKAGERYKTLQASVDYLWEDRLTGDSEQRTGQVYYQRETPDTPAKFRVQFETLKQGEGKTIKDKVDYAFDGQVLTVVKHRIRQITRFMVAAPGQKIDAMKLGRGPFPLPFGQKTKDMLEFFEVQTGPADQKDAPPNTDYLLLKTRLDKRKETNLDKAEMWVDRATGLPVRIISRENRTKRTTTVNFTNVKTDVSLSEDTFLLPKPPGYELNVEKFDPAKASRP